MSQLQIALTAAWRISKYQTPVHVWRRGVTDFTCTPEHERFCVAATEEEATAILGEQARLSYEYRDGRFFYVNVVYFLYRDAGLAARRRFSKEGRLFDLIAFLAPHDPRRHEKQPEFYSTEHGVFSILPHGEVLPPDAQMLRQMREDGTFPRKRKRRPPALQADDDDSGPYIPQLPLRYR